MLKLGKEKSQLNVVNDQYGSPTYTFDLSRLLIDLIETDKYGIYHATNEGVCTWFEFTKEIFLQAKITTPVYPISSSEYPTKALRPKNSCLSKTGLDNAGFSPLPNWRDALTRYLKEIEVI
jgi:dTDP-4-dehydrorhamnose reductase